MKPVLVTLEEGAWLVAGAGHAPARFAHERSAATGTAGAPPLLPRALVEHMKDHWRHAPVEVAIGGGWMRLLLLPFSPRIDSEARWEPFAHARFEQIYGDSAQGWALAWLSEPPPHARLAAALPQSLLAGLREAFAGRLRTVRARTVTRVQTLRQRQPRFSGVVCELATQHAWLTLLHEGRPQRVRLRRGPADGFALGAAITTEWAALAAQVAGLPAAPAELALSIDGPVDDAVAARLQSLAPRVSRVA